jgi:hypothetical protein
MVPQFDSASLNRLTFAYLPNPGELRAIPYLQRLDSAGNLIWICRRTAASVKMRISCGGLADFLVRLIALPPVGRLSEVGSSSKLVAARADIGPG